MYERRILDLFIHLQSNTLASSRHISKIHQAKWDWAGLAVIHTLLCKCLFPWSRSETNFTSFSALYESNKTKGLSRNMLLYQWSPHAGSSVQDMASCL